MAYQQIRTPFENMTWAPDVPSNNLAPNEYNSGLNVETDTRGIQKVLGEQQILANIPGNVIYSTGGYRTAADGTENWTYVVATLEGNWFALTTQGISNVTPQSNAYVKNSYTVDLEFTDDWSGTTLFINDSVNPPMYLIDPNSLSGGGGYADYIRIYDQDQFPYTSITPQWNYPYTDPNLGTANSVTAGFVRVYNSPNLGNILVAGRLKINWSTGLTRYYPTTIRWSQNFAQTGIPNTWQPTLNNVANEVDIPVRGDIVDGFQFGGNFYILSYWDTVVMLPINYTTSQAPTFAIRLFNQGRGLLNPNAWINTDDRVYGVDARDIWAFDGSTFTSLGNQRVKNWFFNNLNSLYAHQVFCINNTRRNQFEIYFPDLQSTGWCNQMISYRYDLDIWNPPRTIANACHGLEAPEYESGLNLFNPAKRITVYVQGSTPNSRIIQKDTGNSFIGNTAIATLFERTNISFKLPYSQKTFTHRIMPEITGNGNINVSVGGSNSVAQSAVYQSAVNFNIQTNDPWAQINQNDSRMTAIKFSEASTQYWKLSAVNWLITPVEDSF